KEEEQIEDGPSETEEKGKRRRSSRNISKIVKYTVYVEESEEKIVKKRKCESNDKRDKAIPDTPQCVVASCEKHPTTAYGYVMHLITYHETTLKKNGMYILCSCGFKYKYQKSHEMHDKKCTGSVYDIFELDEE
ncbi:hypothetical protein PMAYCL1PPCAC_13828, partial [Pristionchus mayeri]